MKVNFLRLYAAYLRARRPACPDVLPKDRFIDYWIFVEKRVSAETELLELYIDDAGDPDIQALLAEEIRFRRQRYLPVIRERLAA